MIIIGAGAAGLMCAAHAIDRNKRVIVLEHQSAVGKKILISGGGRCNFTNLHCSAENFISGNSHFAKSALARYTQHDFIALLEKHRIPYHEKKLGQLFCDRSAKDIVGLLESECRGAEIYLGCRVNAVEKSNEFVVETQKGEFRAPALVIASGGLSIPKIGASSFGYDIAKQFSVRVTACRPGLVPLTFHEADRSQWGDLAGLAADCVARVGSRSFQERLLFTHKGLSGPAILQVSSYWRPPDPLSIVFCQGEDGFLPRRLAQRLTGDEWLVEPAGTEGYVKAEVTLGGICTDELSSKTFESLKVPGLFFIGEVVDVTGHLGGHNFQWAWASGAAAGQAV
ncbi:MAG: aminoacetone oxidase family FAD-binding enzyme [Bryobacteraceae bacterium]